MHVLLLPSSWHLRPAVAYMHSSWTVPGFDTRELSRGLLETRHKRVMPK